MPLVQMADERAAIVFSAHESKGIAEDFLEDLRENWRETASQASKLVTLIVLLMAVFELLVRSAIEKASLGPFEIKDLSLVRGAIPAIIAYLLYDLLILAYRTLEFRDTHDTVMRVVHPAIHQAELDALLWPNEHSLSGVHLLGRQGQKTMSLVSNGIQIVFGFGILVFEIYAFWREFTLNSSIILTSILLIATVLFFIAGCIVFYGNPTPIRLESQTASQEPG